MIGRKQINAALGAIYDAENQISALLPYRDDPRFVRKIEWCKSLLFDIRNINYTLRLWGLISYSKMILVVYRDHVFGLLQEIGEPA